MPNQKIINLNSYISESFIKIEKCTDIFILNESSKKYDIYLNSCKVSFSGNYENVTESESVENVGSGHLRIYIDPSHNESVNFIINLYERNDDGVATEEYASYKCVYTPSIININNVNSNSVNDIQSSYMLIRTNPKLSGNIKLVVNSDDNLYLDTFGINAELSQLKYRKREVGINSYFSNDVRNVFKTISSDSLYSIPLNGNNLRSKIDDQFIDTYHYGVKLNTNRLYTENFAFLAPLWINHDLPDYFVIFKVNNFKNNKSLNATDRLNYCIENGTLVKSFDMKRNSKLGKYLRNHQSEITNYMSSAYISNSDNECNSWYGVSIDSGIITHMHEDTYEIDTIDSQVKYDNFITLGYERNRLLSPYLINLEFMFNDANSTELSINQYIGFYIYNHEFRSIYKIDGNEYDDNYDITERVNFLQNENMLNKRLFNISINSINNESMFYRFTTDNEVNTILSNLDNIPYKNILSCPINDSAEIKNHPQFITITLNEPLQVGEHLRIIDKNDSDSGLYGEIYEVIGSQNKNEISIVYSSDQKIKCTYGTFIGYDDYNIDNKKEIIKNQIIDIVNTFSSMNNVPFKISTYSDESISFMAIDAVNMLTFERITNEIIYDVNNNILDDIDNDNTVTYFNNFTIPSSILKIEADYDNDLSIYLPINFEVWNNRKVYIVNFTNYNTDTNVNVNSGNSFSYSIDKKYIINKIDKECLTISNNNYIKLNNFHISYSLLNYEDNNASLEYNNYSSNARNIIISPHNNNEYIIQTSYNADIHNNVINLYSLAKIHFNIAGISPVKDFAFNILDGNNSDFKLLNTNTIYSNSFSDIDVITLKCEKNKTLSLDVNTLYKVESGKFKTNNTTYMFGEYIPFGTQNVIGINENNTLSIYSAANNDNYFYIQPVVADDYSFENFNDYINEYASTLNTTYSNKNTYIPLITPIHCKWNINGTDVFGNNIKNICKKSTNNNIDVFYSDIDLLGYSSFKYTNDNPLYIYNNVNDIVNDDTLVNNIINGKLPISSIFSNDKNMSNKFSTLFYNKNKNSLETTFCGKKITLKFSKLNDISMYNGYMFSIINSPCSNKSINDVDILISDKENICLVIKHENIKSGLESYKNDYIIDNIYNENENTPDSECPFSILSSNIKLSDFIEQSSTCIPITNGFNIDGSANVFIAAITDNTKNIYKKHLYTYEIQGLENDNIYDHYIDVDGINDASIIKSIDNSLNISDNNIEQSYNDVYEYVIGNVNIKNDNNINDITTLNNTLYIIDKSMSYDNIVNISYDNIINESYYINPEFTDIITFSNIENDIINSLSNSKLVSSNTNINNVNTIKQLWINKVYDTTNFDGSMRNGTNSYGIDCIFNYNPLLTEWDDVRRIYSNDDTYRSVKGFELNNKSKLFFGSVAPTINNEYIELNKWDNVSITKVNREYTLYNSEIERYAIKLDLTNALLSYIKNETSFIDNNWGTTTYNNIDDYIKNILSYYYIINNKNILTVFRHYSSDITEANKFINFDNNISYEICQNITFNIVLENNNHYYLIFELPVDNYQYSIKYKITK